MPSRTASVRESETENSLDVYEPEPGTTSFPPSSHPAPTTLLSPHLNFGAPMFLNSIGVSPQASSDRTIVSTSDPSRIQKLLPPRVTTSMTKAPEGGMSVSKPISFASPELHLSDAPHMFNHSNNTSLSSHSEAPLPQSYTPVFVSNPFKSISSSIRPNSKLPLVDSTTATILPSNPSLPEMITPGMSFPTYTEDENSIRRASSNPTPVTTTSTNTPQHTWQPVFPAQMNNRSEEAIPFPDHANVETSARVIQKNFETDVSQRHELLDELNENLDENPSYVTSIKSNEESNLTTTPYNSGEAVSVRRHGAISVDRTNITQDGQLANSSTDISLSSKPGLPGMTSSSTNLDDGNSFRIVFNTSNPTTTTSNNPSKHTWQPVFPAHMNKRPEAAIHSPYHPNAETSSTSPTNPSNVDIVKSSEHSVHTTKLNHFGDANVELPSTNIPHDIQENDENDVSQVKALPDDQYENLDNNPSDVITARFNAECVNATKPKSSAEALSLQKQGNLRITGTNTSQGKEEYYENDTPEPSLSADQYEDVDNTDKNVSADEDATYEDADAPSHCNNQAVKPKIIRSPEKNNKFQEQQSVNVPQRQLSLVRDNAAPPLPPRWTEMQSQSPSPSTNNSPSINKPHLYKPDTTSPTEPQHSTERQRAMNQDSNIYGTIPSRPPPLPSVPPPLPPRTEVKVKKKILPSLPKVIGIRKEKDKTKDKKSKSSKDRKAKQKGTLQYGNEDIILISKPEGHFLGTYKPSGNYQTVPNVLPPLPPTTHANTLTSTSPIAHDTQYDSDDGNEFIYEGDEYYTSLGMNVLEAERISMKLPASNTSKSSLSLRNDINNFLNNEYNYLGSVERISKARNLFPTQMQSLLRGTEALYDTHNTMYGKMYASQSSCSKLAGVFMGHRQELEMYKYYMMNAPQMSNILKELPQTLKQNYPQLNDDIRGSWNRLHYYFMTLERMLDSAPEEDKASVTEAVEMLRDLHLQADSGILIDSVKDAPYDLHLRSPLLLHHSFTMTGPGLKGRDFRVLLFRELIVITVPKQEQYDYQIDFRVEQTSIVSSDQDTNSFSLEITLGGSKKKQIYSFRTSDEHVKEVWVKQIKRLQDEHAEKVKRERNKRYGLQ